MCIRRNALEIIDLYIDITESRPFAPDFKYQLETNIPLHSESYEF